MIGAVCCLFDSSRQAAEIATLAVQAVYTRRGIATRLLDLVMGAVHSHGFSDDSDGPDPGGWPFSPTGLCLFVKQDNEDAVEFYKKNQFAVQEVIPDYYDGEEDAFLMVRSVVG